MADDVSLNLRSSGFDGVTARTQIAVGPASIVDGVLVTGFELAVGAKQLLGDLLEALVQLAPEDLLDRSFRAGNAGRAEAAEGSHLVPAHDLDLCVALCEFLAYDGICGGRTAVALGRPRQLCKALHVPAVGDLESSAEGAALVHERAHGHGPSFVHFAYNIFYRHANVVEEELVEFGLAGHLPQRAYLYAVGFHVDQEHGQAFVLGHRGIGAYDQLAPVGGPAIAVPDFLAVDN